MKDTEIGSKTTSMAYKYKTTTVYPQC